MHRQGRFKSEPNTGSGFGFISEDDFNTEHERFKEDEATQREQRHLRPVHVDISGEKPLAICSVVYLGATNPEQGASGLHAVQKPLLQLYEISTGFPSKYSSPVSTIIRDGAEATIAVYPFGVKLIHYPDKTSQSINVWFPISNLFVCAAVRCVRSLPPNRRFVPLDLAEADESNEPPLFAAIFRQSRAKHIAECFCFVCKSKQNAMDLVIGCTTAFENYAKGPSIRNRIDKGSDRTHSDTADDSPVDEDYEIPDRTTGTPSADLQLENDRTNDEWQPVLMRR